MIVIDTSALMAIVLGEPIGARCADAILAQQDLLIAAPTVTECLIVARGRRLDSAIEALLADLAPAIVPLDGEAAHAAADAYRNWGKGFHPAALNFGDCFAYALAKMRGCPLLFVGNDFSQTDIASVL